MSTRLEPLTVTPKLLAPIKYNPVAPVPILTAGTAADPSGRVIPPDANPIRAVPATLVKIVVPLKNKPVSVSLANE